MPNNNLSKTKQKEIKDLIEKGREQGFLTIGEINDLLPTNLYDGDQIDGIIKLITDLKIKVVESNKDIQTEVVIGDEEVTDDDDNEITEQEAVEVLSNLDEEFGRTSDPVRMYMREMGTVELLNRAGEIIIAKKIEEGQKLIYQAIQRFPESISYFLKLFKDEEEIEAQISDYILDVKEKADEEFKTEQIPEAPAASDKDDEIEDSEEEEEEIIDNSPDRELVCQKVLLIKEYFDKYKSQKDQAKAEKIFDKIRNEISNFKFTSLFIEKLISRIENISKNIIKYEKDVFSLCLKQTSLTKKEFVKLFKNNVFTINIFFTRLKGHGLDGQSLAEASFDDWMIDTKEAIDIGNVIGDKLILIGCSTGCSLIHTNLQYSTNTKAVIYVSPNFGPKSYLGQLLRVPGAKFFIPYIFGKEHSFEPRSIDHARCWTTSYPIKALFAVKDSVVAAYKVKHNKIKEPILFWFSDDDQVVSARATRKIISKMGKNVSVHNPHLTDKDDSSKHGVLGDILSSSQTKDGVKKIIIWLKGYI